MYTEHNLNLNLDSFLLSIVIMICIILSVFTCVLIRFKKIDKSVKLAYFYLIAILLIYQISTLLAFYSTLKIFEIMISIKIITAFLLKTAIMLFIAVYMRNSMLIKIFLGFHILSYISAFPYFMIEAYRNSIFIISEPNSAYYGSGSQIYTIASSVLYIIAGVLFYLSNKLFRQKKRYLIFLLLLVAVNVAVLFFYIYFSKDAVHEKMHIYILLIQIAFLLKTTPFYDKKDALLSAHNIIDGIDETLIIFNKQGKISYLHNSFKDFDIALYIAEIVRLICMHDGKSVMSRHDIYQGDESFYEGEITIIPGKTVYLHYKLSPLFYKKIYIGKIIILRDMTVYTELIEKLNEKNTLLKEAFERQKEHIHVTRRLIGEEERSKILQRVNDIAGGYLKKLREQVYGLEAEMGTDSASKQKIKDGNDRMLLLTQNTIDEIRKTVKQLYTRNNAAEGE